MGTLKVKRVRKYELINVTEGNRHLDWDDNEAEETGISPNALQLTADYNSMHNM